MSKYRYWSSDAVYYATGPTRLAYYLFFQNDCFPDSCLPNSLSKILGGGFILLSLPLDLLVGLFTLPVGVVHDLFAFIGNCFDDLINDNRSPSSFKNSTVFFAGTLSLFPVLGSGALILNSFGIESGWFEEPSFDPLRSVAFIPIFILSLPISLVALIISLPIAATIDFFKLLGSCIDESPIRSLSC